MTLSLVLLIWACGTVAHMAVFSKLFNKITLSDAVMILFISWVGVFVGGMFLIGKATKGFDVVIWRRK